MTTADLFGDAPAASQEVTDISLPLVDSSYWTPEIADIGEWVRAYPAVNVEEELRKARAWLSANPKNRKTKAGIKRFCVSWLARAQDRGGRSPFAAPARAARLPVSADLVDVSWVDCADTRRRAAERFIATRGCYWDGDQFRQEYVA